MSKLRGKDGCPWDKEQTWESIKSYVIEESYELLEAVDGKNPDKIKEELGDLLFQIIFYAKIAEEQEDFDIYDVCNYTKEKMIRRHPHVFGNINLTTSKDVLKRWEDIKSKEPENVDRKSALDGVPKDLPSLLRAQRLQQKAGITGFDWDNIEQVFQKIEEELAEFKQALFEKKQIEIEHELGDLLFALVNVGRFIKVNSEEALRKTITRFIKRFKFIEEETKMKGKSLNEMSLQEMDVYWERAKKLEKENNPI